MSYSCPRDGRNIPPSLPPCGRVLNKHNPSLKHFQRLRREVPRGQRAEQMWKTQSARPKIPSHRSEWLLIPAPQDLMLHWPREAPALGKPMNTVCPQSRSGQLQPVSYIKQIKPTTAAIPLSHPPNPITPPVSNAGDGEECGPGSHSAGLPEEELDPFD